MAIDLTECIDEVNKAAHQAMLDAGKARRERSGSQVSQITALPRSKRKKGRALWIGLACSVVAGGIFHGIRLTKSQVATAAAFGVPKGMVGGSEWHRNNPLNL